MLSYPLTEHSSMSRHVIPSPEYPSSQEQVKLPTKSSHVASAWHGLVRHSSMFVQLFPSPENPSSQTQVKLPIVSVHNPPIGSQGGISDSLENGFEC